MMTVSNKAAMLAKLQVFLDECDLDAKIGLAFSGEAWAYKRMMRFVESLPDEEKAMINTAEAA